MGYTQREAALALGLSAGGYADLETGKGGRVDPLEPERERPERGRRYVPRIVALAAAAVQGGLYPYIAPEPELAVREPLPKATRPPDCKPEVEARIRKNLAEWDD